MTVERERMRERVRALVEAWGREGLPSRQGLESAAADLASFRRQEGLPGLLGEPPPLMLTATLDDGWGNGLRSIELLAEAAGLEVERLGLLLDEARVLAACRQREPALLGLTILQFHSEEALAAICAGVPAGTRVVAGGPVFQMDDELAERSGVHVVVRDAGAFLRFLLGEAD